MMPVPKIKRGHEGIKKIIRLMIPAIFGSSVAQINLLLDTVIASFLITGSITWLYYSDRLLEFPWGIRHSHRHSDITYPVATTCA